jgi:hypothetical protein
MNHDNKSTKEFLRGLHDQIAVNQRADNPSVLCFTHDPTGLGAQISRRVLAFRIGLLTGCRVAFPSESMYPYQNAFVGIGAIEPTDGTTVIDPYRELGPGHHVFDFWGFWENVALRNRFLSSLPVASPSVSWDIGLALDGVICSFFELKPDYQKMVEGHRRRLELPHAYIGVHYRRGDKRAETPYVPVEDYRRSVLELARNTGLDSVYIASDSSDAVRELDLESAGLKVFFDRAERRLNNANHRYLMANQEESTLETETAIKNIYLLAGAQGLVGQSNAHFATLAASMISAHDPDLTERRIIIIPGDILMRKTSYRILYGLRAKVRAIGKMMMPWLTVKSKSQGRAG